MIRTVGHGTLSETAFVELVGAAGIETVADVRRYPGSRHNPQFGSETMQAWLAAHGIGYAWLSGLGGRRRTSADSVNVALRNPQFRAYADHMASAEFAAGVAELVELASAAAVVVMCSESVWWRCHRRLLADHLVLVEGQAVQHLFHDGRLVPHPLTDGARRLGDLVVYDAAPVG